MAQAVWHPGSIRTQAGLFVSDAEKQTIRDKLPRHQDGQMYADAIFEGGGVKGFAFLGAIRCCSDIGIHWQKLAGTSAGAITASLLASKLTVDDLERVLGELNFAEFLSEKTSPLIWNGNPEDDLKSPLQMMFFLLMARRLGEYSSAPFKQWVKGTLEAGNLSTFADLTGDRALKVVVSDISQGEMLVLPDDLARSPDDNAALRQHNIEDPQRFSVAEAVRLSMSIPFFFEPGKLGKSVIVDGGILSNFPLWIYDSPRRPRWPTFGFRLVEGDKQSDKNLINGPFSLLGAMIETMMVANDRYHLSKLGQGRVINFDVTATGVSTTKFNLTNRDKDELYRIGYLGTKSFFLQDWDWNQHLISRGFPPNSESSTETNAIA